MTISDTNQDKLDPKACRTLHETHSPILNRCLFSVLHEVCAYKVFPVFSKQGLPFSRIGAFSPSVPPLVVGERRCLPNNSLENPEGNNNSDNDFLHTLPFGKINALSLEP
jgi:hypothetical protein